MLEYLAQLAFWDWLAFGTLLLIIEVFGMGGYLLWMAIAALAVGGLTYLFPSFNWMGQFLLFAALSLLSAWWWRAHQKPGDEPLLNRRADQLLGQIFTLEEAIVDGRGKIRVGDSVWPVTGHDQAAGTQVQVVASNGMLLEVAPPSDRKA